jgi:hypothetical protein
MIVSAHQPAYLPWLGYLDKIARADLFVLMDDVQYEPQNFQNRNRLKVSNGSAWVTVPVCHGPQEQRICDKRIADAASPKEQWQGRTWRTLRTHYGRAPHFARYAGALEEVYTRHWDSLVALDLHLTRLMLEWLGIERPIVVASSLGVSTQKTERIRDMCLRVGATTYLSGAGGSRGYLDVEMLRAAGVAVEWQSFVHPSYPQRYPRLGFIRNLSALDLILNCGPESRSILFAGADPDRRPAPALSTAEGGSVAAALGSGGGR